MDKKHIFKEFQIHLMNDSIPSNYFNNNLKNEYFNFNPFNMLKKLTDVPQSPKFHPEGSVWNHTMLVIDTAATYKNFSKNPIVFMWAALLHDIGKADTTKILKKGKITSYDHDKLGQILSKKFLKELTDDTKIIDEVSLLIKWHMQPLFVVKDLPFKDIESMKSEVSIDEIALLSLCDRLGRGNMSYEKIEEEKQNIKYFLQKCSKVYTN
ncbi:multifunctional CCA protein [Clostridium acetireducens DSM 10703]|uniref:Multifunctional CCA protein n=1 Tax=Clostridium acetireducens DSM 10703 TaxID=1121290 RepID=A0A1E8F0F3_9CLOT|nr:HD domain-containing protein [Clostridium acetireducens]OFI06609.1 multifunctional CCA protein [Clostridium acetireducens DSM 10703]